MTGQELSHDRTNDTKLTQILQGNIKNLGRLVQFTNTDITIKVMQGAFLTVAPAYGKKKGEAGGIFSGASFLSTDVASKRGRGQNQN